MSSRTHAAVAPSRRSAVHRVPDGQLPMRWLSGAVEAAAREAHRTTAPLAHPPSPEPPSIEPAPPAPADPRVLLTIAEVSRALHIGRRQTWEIVWRGELPVVRLGPRTIRVARSILEDYVVGLSRPYSS